jgi:hypothetical protein
MGGSIAAGCEIAARAFSAALRSAHDRRGAGHTTHRHSGTWCARANPTRNEGRAEAT